LRSVEKSKIWLKSVKTTVTLLEDPDNVHSDQKVSVNLMITVQKIRKNILNSFNHLP
jgi:hypothetical protein